jgi:hypothetical protein
LSVVHTAFLRVYEETVTAMGLHLLDADTRFSLLDAVGAPGHGELDVPVAPFVAKQNLGPVMSTGAGLGALLTPQPLDCSDARRTARTYATATMNEVSKVPNGYAALQAPAHG